MTEIPVLAKALAEHRRVLNEVESKEVLKEAGIPITEAYLAKSRDEATAQAKKISFPVVLKVLSPQIVHKSDIGGVKLGLNSESEVASAYDEVLSAVKSKEPSATIDGVSVQGMARPGIEVIIGMSKDPQFGPVLMFGLGGVLVEVLKDISFRIVPLTQRDAREMIREIKGYPILEGYRGQEPADVGMLEETLLKLSKFVEAHSEIKEIDLNPIFVYRDGLSAVDARIILEENAQR
ncbi:MAG: acetate--CoA ligase family protein [Dehalococcoidia bacterium]